MGKKKKDSNPLEIEDPENPNTNSKLIKNLKEGKKTDGVEMIDIDTYSDTESDS